MDDALRACERGLAEGRRSPAELLRLRLRAGRLDPERVEAAARLGSRAACGALGRRVRREPGLEALLAAARQAGGPTLAWAVCAVAEWLAERPGEVQDPALVRAAVAAVRDWCDRPEQAEDVGTFGRAAAASLAAAREALRQIVLGGGDLELGDGELDEWRAAELACLDAELEQLVLAPALGQPADLTLELALRARVRGPEPSGVDDHDEDALDDLAWEADRREREATEHARSALVAWLLGTPPSTLERGGRT